jgi:hypothetical protein
MIEPHVHVAYAAHGAGLLCAVFWLVQGRHVYGWFTGARGQTHPACFFALEDYYAKEDTVFYRSAQNDVHGRWLIVAAGGEIPIERGPIPEALRHELERLQDAFVREWLFYRDDAGHAGEAAALRARGLPLRAVNVRPKKLAKLQPGTTAATYASPDADLNVIAFLAARWPLDYAPV